MLLESAFQFENRLGNESSLVLQIDQSGSNSYSTAWGSLIGFDRVSCHVCKKSSNV